MVSTDVFSVHRWRAANRCHSQDEIILVLTPDTAVMGGNKIYTWCSTWLPIVFCSRTRRYLPQHEETLHFWPTAEGQVLLQNGQSRWLRARRCLVRGVPSIRIDGRLLCWSSGLGGAGVARHATPQCTDDHAAFAHILRAPEAVLATSSCWWQQGSTPRWGFHGLLPAHASRRTTVPITAQTRCPLRPAIPCPHVLT